MQNTDVDSADNTRIPYRLMHDPEIYRQEQERIFKGPAWHYLCLDAELSQPGAFITTRIGDTPVIVTRDEHGELHGLINRCRHKAK